MKLLVIGDRQRAEKYMPDLPVTKEVELLVAKRGSSNQEILAFASDADFILADAISPVDAELMDGMKNLKLVHSEGVAFNAIDLDAARSRGIVVCNNAGANADGVAEQAILLMLSCLRDVVCADNAVRSGNQIKVKENMMVEGIRELGDCTVGLVGLGAIGQATATKLKAWGCKIFYNKRTRLSEKAESELAVTFAELEQIITSCDIISIHVPVTDQTRGMVDAAFLAKMKPDSILINTARGEIVNNEALVEALETGSIAAAGLDTVAPEPVELDNPLINMSESAMRRVVFSPHIGGVTEGMFYRAHRTVWENVARVIAGETPINIVS